MMSNQSFVGASALLVKVGCPLLLILGIFGSIMTIIVFRLLKGCSPMSTYYTALALSDLVSLTCGWTLHFWIYYQFDLFLLCLHTAMCKITVFVASVSCALSSWYLVAMTIQRAMSVVWPHRVNVVCTRNVSRVVTAVIALVIMASYSHVLLGYSMLTCNNSSSCEVCMCGPAISDYIHLYSLIWPFIDLVVSSIAPFMLLIVSNIVLVRKVLTSVKKARQSLAVGQSMHVTARERKASSMTVTLIVLSFSFFVMTGPHRVQLIISPIFSFKAIDISASNLIFYVIFILLSANGAVNFYLYCLTGTKFRQEIARLLFGSFI